MGNIVSDSGLQRKSNDNWKREKGDIVLRKVAIAKLFPDEYQELALPQDPQYCENLFQEGDGGRRRETKKKFSQCQAINEEVHRMTRPIADAEKEYEKFKKQVLEAAKRN